MAKDKSEKKAKKAAKAAKAKKVGAKIEMQSRDMAYKIWLAGVGAYGKAYDEATQGFENLSETTKKARETSAELFEELVKRGAEIEGSVKTRIVSDERVLKAGQQFSKVRDAASDMTEKSRERFEARMERMRDLLGLKGKGDKADDLHAKLDKLEDELASVSSKAKKGAKAAGSALKERIARLTAEIDAVEGKASKTVDTAAKATKKVAKTAAKTAKKAVETVATDANGRLTKPMGTPDDLKLIKGVGPALETKLNTAGIFHFWQVAQLKKAQIAELESDMGFPGRIGRDEWVKQAKALAKTVAA